MVLTSAQKIRRRSIVIEALKALCSGKDSKLVSVPEIFQYLEANYKGENWQTWNISKVLNNAAASKKHGISKMAGLFSIDDIAIQSKASNKKLHSTTRNGEWSNLQTRVEFTVKVGKVTLTGKKEDVINAGKKLGVDLHYSKSENKILSLEELHINHIRNILCEKARDFEAEKNIEGLIETFSSSSVYVKRYLELKSKEEVKNESAS